MGLISNTDESAYRDEVRNVIAWCSANNLILNKKTKEIVVDFKKIRTDPSPDEAVESLSRFKFLGNSLRTSLRTSPGPYTPPWSLGWHNDASTF